MKTEKIAICLFLIYRIVSGSVTNNFRKYVHTGDNKFENDIMAKTKKNIIKLKIKFNLK